MTFRPKFLGVCTVGRGSSRLTLPANRSSGNGAFNPLRAIGRAEEKGGAEERRVESRAETEKPITVRSCRNRYAQGVVPTPSSAIDSRRHELSSGLEFPAGEGEREFLQRRIEEQAALFR